MSTTLLAALRTYWKAFHPVRWLFEGQTKGQPLSPSTADKVFTAAAGRAGIAKGLSLHSPRHAFATLLLEGGSHLPQARAVRDIVACRSWFNTEYANRRSQQRPGGDARSVLGRV